MIGIALVQHAQHFGALLPAVLYIGPDVFLPLTSALAAIAGVLLMFWQRIVLFVGRLFGRQVKDSAAQSKPVTPDNRPD